MICLQHCHGHHVAIASWPRSLWDLCGNFPYSQLKFQVLIVIMIYPIHPIYIIYEPIHPIHPNYMSHSFRVLSSQGNARDTWRSASEKPPSLGDSVGVTTIGWSPNYIANMVISCRHDGRFTTNHDI